MPPSGPRTKLPIPVPAPVPVQPGLSLPRDFPPLAAPQPAASVQPKLQKKITPSASTGAIKPVIPVVPPQSAKGAVASVAKDQSQEPPIAMEDSSIKATITDAIESMSKPRFKKEATSSDTIARPLNYKNGKTSESAVTGDGLSDAESPKKSEQEKAKTQRASAKRHPGALNIEATKARFYNNASQIDEQSADAVPASSTSASAASQPQTPSGGDLKNSAAATAKNSQLRTIRMLPTSTLALRSEASRRGPSAAVPKDSLNTTSVQALSRRASLSSMNPPGTPASERISDNVSLTSTSMSRANSPPPSKIGIAITRHVSKSQQKKERQARAKQAEEATKVEEVPVKSAPEEPFQAPIIGRKKKQKKAAKGETADSTPAVTRPGSPIPHEANIAEEPEITPMTPVRDGKNDEAKAAAESEAETAFSPPGPTTGTDQQQRNTLIAAALFSALQISGGISSTALDIFKPVMGLNHRFDIDIQSLDHIPEVGTLPKLTEAQDQELERGRPVCVDQGNNKRVIVLPDRRTLRGLTPEQAHRYLQLRKQALDTSQELFVAGHGPAPPKPPQPANKDDDGTPKHLPNPFLAEAQTQSAATSISRLPQAFGSIASANPTTYVDEAAAFIATRRNTTGSIMGVEEAERALSASKRETEAVEKKLNGLLRRNRRLVT